MSKLILANCQGGVVTAKGVPVPTATILSEGVGASEGALILDGSDAVYIPKASPDLKTTLQNIVSALAQVKTALDKTVEACNKAASALTTIDAKPVGGTGSAPAPGATADITAIGTATAAITTASGAIDAVRGDLDTLTGVLK